VINNLTIDSTTIRTAYKSPLYYAYKHLIHYGQMPDYQMMRMTTNRKTYKNYIIFGWATTDADVSRQIRSAALDAKAMILDMESAKIKMRNQGYEPIWLSMAKHREEVQERKSRNVLGDPIGTTYDYDGSDLPF